MYPGGAGDDALGTLTALTAQYGQCVPLSDYTAHGPRLAARQDATSDVTSGRDARQQYSAPLYNTAPLVSPLRHSDSADIIGPTSFGPAPTTPVHFAHNLPVKLTPDNYLFWRAQIIPLLRSHSLECFVDGTCPCPPPAHPSYRFWIAQDQAILSALQASLSEGVAGLVLFAATARDVWVTLENNFSS
jgi:hypothetical protein